MGAAQKLYEAGYITYMRTDSTNMSADAQKQIIAMLQKNSEKTMSLLEPTKQKASLPRKRMRL